MTDRSAIQYAAVWAGKARRATEDRDSYIRQAYAEGASLRKIGALTGLSHTAIAKIVRRAQ